MTVTVSDDHRERIRIAVQTDNTTERLQELAAVTVDIGEENDVDDLEALASHVAIREVVGVGALMTLGEVLDHLGDLIQYHESLATAAHGGDEDLLETLTLNERFDHNAYYALQTLYAKLIYEELPDHQKEVETSDE